MIYISYLVILLGIFTNSIIQFKVTVNDDFKLIPMMMYISKKHTYFVPFFIETSKTNINRFLQNLTNIKSKFDFQNYCLSKFEKLAGNRIILNLESGLRMLMTFEDDKTFVNFVTFMHEFSDKLFHRFEINEHFHPRKLSKNVEIIRNFNLSKNENKKSYSYFDLILMTNRLLGKNAIDFHNAPHFPLFDDVLFLTNSHVLKENKEIIKTIKNVFLEIIEKTQFAIFWRQLSNVYSILQ